jgi:hypothetical protein
MVVLVVLVGAQELEQAQQVQAHQVKDMRGVVAVEKMQGEEEVVLEVLELFQLRMPLPAMEALVQYLQ